MALGNVYKVGPGSVGSYQISGIPWAQTWTCTADTVDEINFNIASGADPQVTRWIKIRNLDATSTVKLGFSAAGVASAAAGQNPWIQKAHGFTLKCVCQAFSLTVVPTPQL